MNFSKAVAICILTSLSPLFISAPSLASESKQLTLAQQKQSTLENDFTTDTFAHYEWVSPDSGEPIYESGIYIVVQGNKMSIYNTYNRYPLGTAAQCGGFGCDLGKGSLLATLDFVKQGNDYIVRNASQRAAFLQGSRCKVVEFATTILECFFE